MAWHEIIFTVSCRGFVQVENEEEAKAPVYYPNHPTDSIRTLGHLGISDASLDIGGPENTSRNPQ